MDAFVSRRVWRRPPACSTFFPALALTALLAAPASADLVLTPAGIGRGLSVSTFAVDFPVTSGVGPVAIDFQTDGSVLVTTANANLQRFANTDNQSAATTPILANFSAFANAHGLAHLGSTIYMSQGPSADVLELNSDGSVNHVVASGLSYTRALVADNANGHLFAASATGIKEIDPTTGTFTTFAGVEADGLAITQDGGTLYSVVLSGPSAQHILAFNTATGAQNFDSGYIPGGIDGVALGTGLLLGNIYANANNGTVVEVNLTTLNQTVIATGGSRGDFVAVDHSNGSLLLTQSDRILRLHGSFIPAPGAGVLLALGCLGIIGRRRPRA